MNRDRLFSTAVQLGCACVFLPVMGCGGAEDVTPAPIMTFEQYASVQHETPYILELGDGDSRLVYYGVRHSNDPSDPMFSDIEGRFAALKPAVAFNEGGDPPTEASRSAAIGNYGEPGFLRYLAAKYGVEARNLDLPLDEESRVLTAKYSKRDILLFYIVRQLGSYNQMADVPALDQYLQQCLSHFGSGLQMPDASLSMVRMDYERVFGEPFVPRKIERRLSAPNRDGYLTQQISLDSAIARDEHMVRTLVAAVKEHGRVFAVMGSTHVVMQEPALRSHLSR